MSVTIEGNPSLDWFRPRGKIICIGNQLSEEMTIINDIMTRKKEIRLPMLLLATERNNNHINDQCDQVLIFNQETLLPHINSLLNSYFLFFIINSSEPGIFSILGSVLASIEFSGSIPIIIDTGGGLKLNQRKLFSGCYFHFDFSAEINHHYFSILLYSFFSALESSSGIGIDFSDLIRSFGNSKSLFYGISSSMDLEESMNSTIDLIGDNLVNATSEQLERLEMIFLSVSNVKPLSIQQMNQVSQKISYTFGKDFEVRISNSIDSKAQNYNIVMILTDLHQIENIIPKFTYPDNSKLSFKHLRQTDAIKRQNKDNLSKQSSVIDEDERFDILRQIFKYSEVYIFDDGGLPLFASHRPAGQEVCLYTGLFSAIQSMSSDLIGHTPDHLTAGDKRCVFITQNGPNNAQLRGVAICSEGFEQNARNDLTISMNLVRGFLQKGEPEYSVNDKLQGMLVNGYQQGIISNIFQKNFHAS